MATTGRHTVSAEDSDIHDEPRIERRRMTVQFIHERVEGRGLDPRTIADRSTLDIADVYRALTYYHDHPQEMRKVERRRERAIADYEHLTTDPEIVRDR